MPVSFNSLPANWKLPLTWIEVDPSRAGTVTLRQPAILFGIKLAAGTAAVNAPIAIASPEQADDAFGVGSMLSRMFAAFQKINNAAIVYCMPLDEPAAGEKATGDIVVSAAPTASGTLHLYIAGQKIAIGIAASDTAPNVATKIAAAIGAAASLPVAAVVQSAPNTHKVTLTCKWKGTSGNDIKVAVNYNGALGGEVLPAGLALTLPALTGGTSAPDVAAAIAAMGDEIYDYCAFPFTDATPLGAIETEYGFSDNGRWGWMRQTYGTVFSARRDSYANQMTWGAAGNSPVSSVLDVEQAAQSPVWEWTAAYCAVAARGFLNDPARPLQSLELTGIMGAPVGSRRSKTERNNLASTGIAPQTFSGSGVPMIEAEISRYQKNVYGQGDTAYTHITTLHTLAAIFRQLSSAITNKFPRHKLANDGTRFGPGQAIVTPKVIKAELVALYDVMEFNGLVENVNAFKDALIVERDPQNPSRLNVLLPPDIVNQLRVFAVLGQFRLNFQTAA